MTTTFEEARIGDRVLDFVRGWGTVIKIDPEDFYPIRIRLDVNGVESTYTFDGRREKHYAPMLFWDKIKIKAPSKPKRIKYKNVNGFKVPDLIVELPLEPEMIHIRVPRFSTVPGSAVLRASSDSEGLRRLMKHGAAYPRTPEGEDAADANAWALLGEGEPWEEEE